MNRSPSAVRPLTVVPAFALLAAWLAGCSAGPDVLAKVGDRAITRDEFLDVARRAQGQYPGTGDSAKANLLEDLIKRQMLVMAAEKQGLVDAAPGPPAPRDPGAARAAGAGPAPGAGDRAGERR